MQLQSFDLAFTNYRGDGQPVHQFHAFFRHVVEVFGDTGQLLRIAFHRDHGYFNSALPQRFAGAIDSSVSSADHGDASADLYLGRSHADIAQEGKAVQNAGFIFAFGFHAVRFGESNGQHAGVVILSQIVPGYVLATFDIGLDRDAKLFEAFDLAIENVLRKNPVGNSTTIESAGLRRFLEDRHRIAESRKLIRGAVSGWT